MDDCSFLKAPHRPFLDTAGLLNALLAGKTVRVDPFALWSVDMEPVDCEVAAKELMDSGRARVVQLAHCRVLDLAAES